MDSHTKRLTIYVPQDLSRNLVSAREAIFQSHTQSGMLRDPIAKGLQVWESQSRRQE